MKNITIFNRKSPQPECPDFSALVKFAFDEDNRQELRSHIDTCPFCQDVLAGIVEQKNHEEITCGEDVLNMINEDERKFIEATKLFMIKKGNTTRPNTNLVEDLEAGLRKAVGLQEDNELFKNTKHIHVNNRFKVVTSKSYFSKITAAPIWKRGLDIITSSLTIFILSPVIFSIAVLIKLSSKGPILCIVKKRRADGKIFNRYQFRTSRICTVSELDRFNKSLNWTTTQSGVYTSRRYKPQENPRWIWYGDLFMMLGIEKIPYLFNVLKGDVSLKDEYMNIYGSNWATNDYIWKHVDSTPFFCSWEVSRNHCDEIQEVEISSFEIKNTEPNFSKVKITKRVANGTQNDSIEHLKNDE